MFARVARFLSSRRFFCLFLTSLMLFWWLEMLTWQIGLAQTPAGLVEQGVERYQSGDYRGAIAVWETVLGDYQKNNNPTDAALVQENLARAYQQVGRVEEAIAFWDRVINNYRQQGNLQRVGRSLTEQAQAYNRVGQYRNSIALLCGERESECQSGTALQLARQQKDTTGEIAALGSLGESYRLVGDYDRAIQSLETASQFAEPTYQFLLSNSLGNVYLARAQRWTIRANSAQQRGVKQLASQFQQKAVSDYQQAKQNFQSSLVLARQRQDRQGQMKALLNFIGLAYRSQPFNIIDAATLEDSVQQAIALFDTLPDAPNKVYAAIDLANLPARGNAYVTPLVKCPQLWTFSDEQSKTLLENALTVARTLDDSRVLSFALGANGHFYECREQYDRALKLTQEALLAADQNLANPDSLYLWEWQEGRIFKALDNRSQAIASYQRAFTTLEKLRNNILRSEKDLQFDFRDTVEPVYRQLAQLRLDLASVPSVEAKQQAEELTLALKTIDSLRLAELQNYLNNDCVLAGQTETKVEPDTGIFSSIILEEKTAILLNLPNGQKKVHWIDRDRETIIETIKNFRQNLVEGRLAIEDYDTTQAQTLYSWIVAPFEEDLKRQTIKTLIFIHDGIFRIVPMAALSDGKQFLVEKYAIAATPSLSLIEPKKFNFQNSRALILGVTKAAKVGEQTFEALNNVPQEIQEVQNQFRDRQSLLDENFNRDNLDLELTKTPYQIVHIATHAQFGTIPEDTFLVTGNNNKLTINQLENILRNFTKANNLIELLALTACQTAEGDDRATLGLAGVAVQAGVTSTLASLWSIPDESTLNLIAEFYRNLVQQGASKAEALRLAQLRLIKAKEIAEINDQYDNPAYWAPFILLGNWL